MTYLPLSHPNSGFATEPAELPDPVPSASFYIAVSNFFGAAWQQPFWESNYVVLSVART
jgi:hypothetical protein